MLRIHRIRFFGRGSVPDPAGEAHDAPAHRHYTNSPIITPDITNVID